MPNLGTLLEQQKSGFIKIPAMECGGPGSGRKPGIAVVRMSPAQKQAAKLITNKYRQAAKEAKEKAISDGKVNKSVAGILAPRNVSYR